MKYNTRVSVSSRLCVAILLSAALAPAGNDAQIPAGKDFATIGGNLANHRYSSLTRINKSNVATLGGAWSIHLEDGKPPGTMQATPIVVDGVMFVVSGAGNIFAIDAATGAVKWKHETTLGGTYRGVAVADGKVFSGRRDNTLIALDQKTGALVWKTQLADPARGTTSAPAVYYDGLVYIGVGGGEEVSAVSSARTMLGLERKSGSSGRCRGLVNSVTIAGKAIPGSTAVDRCGLTRRSTRNWAWCTCRLAMPALTMTGPREAATICSRYRSSRSI
jgi:outer membrane protein assembly factor BamB